jgi:hypothetical protein
MDQSYAQLDIGKILDEQGDRGGPKLTRAQIHEIGFQAVEEALGPQPDELRPWAEWAPDNERQLANVG